MNVYNDTFILTEGARMSMLLESLEKERQIGQARQLPYVMTGGTTVKDARLARGCVGRPSG